MPRALSDGSRAVSAPDVRRTRGVGRGGAGPSRRGGSGRGCRPACRPGAGAGRAGQVVIYDALRRERCASEGNDAELDDIFASPWDLVGFLGHGDGSHLNLGSAVLCGLTDEQESIEGDATPAPVPLGPASLQETDQHWRPVPGGPAPQAHTRPVRRCCVASRPGRLVPGRVVAQMAALSSVNAMETRWETGMSAASSKCPRRRFCTKACPAAMSTADRRRFSHASLGAEL